MTPQQAASVACSELSDVSVGDVAWLCHRADEELSSVRFAVGELLSLVRAAAHVGAIVPPAQLDEAARDVLAAIESAEREVQAGEVLSLHLETPRS